MNVSDTFCIGKTMTCDLSPVFCTLTRQGAKTVKRDEEMSIYTILLENDLEMSKSHANMVRDSPLVHRNDRVGKKPNGL